MAEYAHLFGIVLAAVLQKSLDRATFLCNLYERLCCVALELSLLCAFENSAKRIRKSFGSDSFLEKVRVLLFDF